MAQGAGSRSVRMPRGRTSSGAARQPRVTTGPYGQRLLGNDTLSTELSTTAKILSEGAVWLMPGCARLRLTQQLHVGTYRFDCAGIFPGGEDLLFSFTLMFCYAPQGGCAELLFGDPEPGRRFSG